MGGVFSVREDNVTWESGLEIDWMIVDNHYPTPHRQTPIILMKSIAMVPAHYSRRRAHWNLQFRFRAVQRQRTNRKSGVC
jgi:hypothetical protein